MKTLVKLNVFFCVLIFLATGFTACSDNQDGNGGEKWITKVCDDSSAPYTIPDAERQLGTFYVGPTGCNLNDGSEDSPWRSISFACNHIKEGSTIRLLAGTIFEDSVCKVPRNVNIIGKGKTISIVKSRFFYPDVLGVWNLAKDKYLFQFQENCDGIEISNFTLDGNEHKSHAGLIIDKVKNIKIKDLVVKNFYFNGIWVANSENLEIANVKFNETSMPSLTSCSGMLMLGNTTNAEINNCEFINSTKLFSGYGIKTWNIQWVTSHPNETDNTVVELTNVNIRNCNFNLYPYGGWRDGNSANICAELYNSSLNKCQITGNTFVGLLSMVGRNSTTAEYAAKVLNNQFLMPTTNEGNQFAIENDFNNVEIANNYFLRGRYPVASWNQITVSNLYVHHNVFDRILLPDGILLFQGGPKNLKFENNSILYDQQVFNFNGPKDGNCVFSIKIPSLINLISAKNNIFYCYDGNKKNNVPLIQIPLGTTITATNIVIDNNAFYNWTPDGTNSIEIPKDSAVFDFTGQTYIQKYGLKISSICSGKNLGAIN